MLTASGQPPTLTFLYLDPLPQEVATGDEIVFSGKLESFDGIGLAGKTVTIMEERATYSNLLATAVTSENGTFIATWIADLDNPTENRIMSIFASFDGESKYTASRSSRVGMKVAIQTMDVSIKLDKRFYFNGDTAIFTITFKSPRGAPFDPEAYRAIFDGITSSLTREEEGVYTFRTPSLAPPKHTLQLIAEKHGYSIFTDAITFDVFARQVVPGVKLQFDWSPKPVLQGSTVTFTLSFTDANNIVTPFVNYDFTVKKGDETILELLDQQTTDGNAALEHMFADGGKYTATVKVNGIGQAPDIRPITLSSDFGIEVIKSTAFAVRVKAMQKDDAVRITFRNPQLALEPVYSVSLKFDDASSINLREPSGWNLQSDDQTVIIDTVDSPLEPGNNLQIRAKAEGPAGSFQWTAMDKDGNVLKSGIAKVRSIRAR
jgi:hypothetical protein